MEIAIKELERAIKYKERELQGFEHKLILLNEQKIQYETDLIPKFKDEIRQLENTILQLRSMSLSEELDLPF